MTTELEAILHHNSKVSADFALLTRDMELNFHKVVMCERTGERVIDDRYATWLALCAPLEDGTWHKWVVWVVTATTVGFHCTAGIYTQDYDEAYEAYWNRAYSAMKPIGAQ